MAHVATIIAVAMSVLLSCSKGAQAAEGPRLALVLVNSAYTRLPALESCRLSAGLMAASLRRAGFDVKEPSNLSNGRIGAAINDFSDAVASASNTTAVFYACGYAVGFERRAFLLPVSAILEQPTDVLSQGLLERQLVSAFVRIPVQAGLMVFDTRARPGADAPLELSTVADAGRLGRWAVIGAHETSIRPSGSTVLVDTMVDVLDDKTLELNVLVQKWQAAAAVPGLTSLALPPDRPTWINGGPASPAAAAPVAAPMASAAPALASLSETDRRRAQLALTRLGYYTGLADGVYGGATLTAIRRYQQATGNPATGLLTEGQAAVLLRDAR